MQANDMLFSRAGECSGDPICKLGDYTAGAKRCGSREGSRGLVCGPEALKPFLFKGLGASDEVKIFSCGSGILPRGYRGWKPLPQRWHFIRDRMAPRTIPSFPCAFRGGQAGARDTKPKPGSKPDSLQQGVESGVSQLVSAALAGWWMRG